MVDTPSRVQQKTNDEYSGGGWGSIVLIQQLSFPLSLLESYFEIFLKLQNEYFPKTQAGSGARLLLT